jgi:hypothetical protein
MEIHANWKQWYQGPSRYYPMPRRNPDMISLVVIPIVASQVAVLPVVLVRSVASRDHLGEGRCMKMRSRLKNYSTDSLAAEVWEVVASVSVRCPGPFAHRDLTDKCSSRWIRRTAICFQHGRRSRFHSTPDGRWRTTQTTERSECRAGTKWTLCTDTTTATVITVHSTFTVVLLLRLKRPRAASTIRFTCSAAHNAPGNATI